MDQLIDYLAIFVFVVVYFTTRDIFLATGVLMAGVTLQLLITRFVLKKQINTTLKLTFWASIVLGGMTLLFRNETFIQWKPTIVYWAMGGALAVSQYVGRDNLVKRVLSSQMSLPEPVWRGLNMAWAVLFVGMGALNLVVAYQFSMDTWVTFKLFGTMAVTFVAILVTIGYLYLKGYLEEPTDGDAGAAPEVSTSEEPPERLG